MIVNGAWRIRIARPITFGSCCSRSRQNAWLTTACGDASRARSTSGPNTRPSAASTPSVEKYSPLARTTFARRLSTAASVTTGIASALLLNAKRPVSDWLRSRRPSNSW